MSPSTDVKVETPSIIVEFTGSAYAPPSLLNLYHLMLAADSVWLSNMSRQLDASKATQTDFSPEEDVGAISIGFGLSVSILIPAKEGSTKNINDNNIIFRRIFKP